MSLPIASRKMPSEFESFPPSVTAGGGFGGHLPPPVAVDAAAAPEPEPENVKAAFGAAKVALGLIPPAFKVALALALQFGARKYGAWNWRWANAKPVRASTYVSAMQRHPAASPAGEDVAPDSGVAHLAHLAASCAILLDAQAAGLFADDRVKVDFAAAIAAAEAVMKGWPAAKHEVFG